jgi:hypothetical protein
MVGGASDTGWRFLPPPLSRQSALAGRGSSDALRRLLKIEDAQLAQDLAAAVSTRNALAHGYLLSTRLDLAAGLTTQKSGTRC